MPKRKKLGHGTLVLVNSANFAFLSEWNPPEWSREIVDVTCMDDEAADALDGDPIDYGAISFAGFKDPDSAEDIAIETFFANDDMVDREATIVVKFRRTGTGTAPALSTWTYNIITYVVRLTKIKLEKVSSKDKMMGTIEGKVVRRPVSTTGG